MTKKPGILIATLSIFQALSAQQKPTTDSATLLSEVTVSAFEQKNDMANGTIVKFLDRFAADRSNKSSLVSGFNTVAGVRMEERSPGSYRLNIRGSSLRSPFGVRNVKVYWNDIPITDPGGNTYFNQFAFNNFSSIEVFKGPAGSLYGAGTGGLLLMHSFSNSWKPGLQAEYVGGSYRLHNILASGAFGSADNRNLISYAHTESDGYRDHTYSKKDNASYVSQIKISDRQQLTASVIFTSMEYQTPGGLTLAEYKANPTQARPAAGGQPSADQAKAAIYQKNFTAGISHSYDFSGSFRNVTTLYGTFAQIKNPTFRNYERRNEPSFGGRTSFIYEKQWQDSRLQLVGGAELQQAYFNTQVSKNKNGNPDTLQTNDDIRYSNYSGFAQADWTWKGRWIITAGASINASNVSFTRLSSYPVQEQSRSYKNQISPRIAISRKIGQANAVFASVSKGYSPPSISELLPSTGVISTNLEAEEGINYELGGRVSLFHRQLVLEATGFYFKINNALVTRKDSSNADYYVNAGNTKQRGLELSASYARIFNNSFVRSLTLKPAYTFSDFIYGDFVKGTIDYSGKTIPSVPKNVLSIYGDIQFKPGLYINANYYSASSIWLDDANTAKADPYHLLGCRVGWKFVFTKFQMQVYTGGENLLDETYSLGNDINAAGGRYYNAAAARNYYAGVVVQLGGERGR